MKHAVYLFLLLITVASCKNDATVSDKGRIQILNNIYYNASKGLEDMDSYLISDINYTKNYMLEFVPYLSSKNDETSFFIIDSVYYQLPNSDIASLNIFDYVKGKKGMPLKEKLNGALFGGDSIPFYNKRKDISDTILFKKNYKRFELENDASFSRYYVYVTDTILPYSFNRQCERDYNGRLERIDTYDKNNDIFVTVQLIASKTYNSKAKEFIEYTTYLKENAQ